MKPCRDTKFTKAIKGDFIVTWPIIGICLLPSLRGKSNDLIINIGSTYEWQAKDFCNSTEATTLPTRWAPNTQLSQQMSYWLSLAKERKTTDFCNSVLESLPHSTCSWWAARLFQHKQPSHLSARKLSAHADFLGWRWFTEYKIDDILIWHEVHLI